MTHITIERVKMERLMALLAVSTFYTPKLQAERTELVEAGLEALAAPVQEPVACFIGARGSAFDLPETKRAYTYKEQPGNTVASNLGRACDAASKQRAGDNIDRGLGLLQELQKEGFGVFALGAEYTTPPAAQPLVPLTDGQIKCMDYRGTLDEHIRSVRMTESAHGITKGQP